jgi:hypothetical protein
MWDWAYSNDHAYHDNSAIVTGEVSQQKSELKKLVEEAEGKEEIFFARFPLVRYR